MLPTFCCTHASSSHRVELDGNFEHKVFCITRGAAISAQCMLRPFSLLALCVLVEMAESTMPQDTVKLAESTAGHETIIAMPRSALARDGEWQLALGLSTRDGREHSVAEHHSLQRSAQHYATHEMLDHAFAKSIIITNEDKNFDAIQ